ncbi:MAG TPA: ABC transporter ATP-binding protein, partial [Lachnospiraceae bacterium]|nr:ABC transporter ATP-binding protein [Lachnospiraceae bacterium]
MKMNKENQILNVYRYFLPSAWKKYKGYFVVRFAKLLVTAAIPFIHILIMPKIIDELLGNRETGILI